MKKFISSVKNASVTVASKGLGAIHFLGQTTADIAMETEASLKLKADGVVKIDTKKHRVLRTIEQQQFFIDRYTRTIENLQFMRDTLSRRGIFREEIITMSTHDLSQQDLPTNK